MGPVYMSCVYMCRHTYVHIRAHMNNIHVHVSICVYVDTHICTYLCIYICVRMSLCEGVGLLLHRGDQVEPVTSRAYFCGRHIMRVIYVLVLSRD